jgi:fatty acid desaturase
VAAPGWREVLSREEIDSLLEVNDLRGALTIALNWAIVFAAMWLVAVAPNVLTVLLAVVVIGTRQLGMAIVMHEASHRTMFRNPAVNDWAGNWLSAYPVWADVVPYRGYHLQHHAKTGTAEDPDLGLVTPFPITRASLRRKIWRDLSGQTGWKQFVAVLRRDVGLGERDEMALSFSRGERPETGWHKLVPVVTTNAVLFGILAIAGHPALYLLWVASWFTTYRLVTRLRSIAEHAVTADANDPLRNTRTTIARWWERLLIAPNRVNYHLEHHLLMTVPHYNLPRMHRLLRDRGALEYAEVEHGYWDVFRRASSREA